MHHPEIAIIDPNTLSCMGLQTLLEEIIPMATIRVFHSFGELVDDTPDMYAHYFVSAQIYFEHTAFFRERRPRAIVLAGGENHQGNAVVNYTEREVPYTRVIEHKHFEMFGGEVYATPKTVISREYSTEWREGMEPYYPVNDERNSALYEQYRALAEREQTTIFGGRLAEYKYYDMAPIVEKVLKMEI